ncbi:MAG: type ISP restriction/modification enzyme [Deltaproteobacteria bacterium]|nr:type ISP restriction/modification enzyme [Deltaproteobacteria bacterium]
MLKSYLKRVSDITNRGDAREESYYSCLEELLTNYADSINRKNVDITTLPKKTDAGNPDFRIWDGKQQIVGYIEAKAPTVEYLDHIEETGQLKRYLHTFPNLILTNFFEFRLYRNGQLIDKAQIARPFVIHKLKAVPPVEKEKDFCNLLGKFFSFSLPKVYDARALAVELAKRTRFLKDEVIAQELEEEEKKGKGNILGFYKAFKEHLISGLTKEDFADLYSQTIAYGLFAARTRTENGFNRKLAYDKIPRTIGILRDVFRFISLGDLPRQMEWIIDDISDVLATTNVYKILDEYFNKHKGKDPIVHFYETFLAEYDPKTREKRGVYYTPEPVVSYIVRSLHNILKKYFEKRDGFASGSVTVLDPAAGTLTFLAETSKLAVEEFIYKYGDGAKEKFIREYILQNFYAFELMMAPYAIGHIKMSFLLEELGCKLKDDDRFNLFLTNTLEMEELEQTSLPGMASLSEESHLAGIVKKEQSILVILGNPPYSGHSTNIGDWISKEIKAYYQVDGKPLGEKNPKWLQDDYVKFIRFAQWKIDQAGEGVLGFITNHSYLDNPTFRGMRHSLMQSFDEIYLLDLHGNSLKKEKCPDGSKDENVFDIRQGVAISLFIKKQKVKEEPIYPMFAPSPQMDIFTEKEVEEKPKKHKCKVFHSEIWGERKDKYNYLDKHDINTTKWKKINPKTEFYLFIPRDEGLLKQYETYPKITDIFPVNSVGIVTARDNFVIDSDRNALKRRIMQFRDKKIPDEIMQQTYNLKDKSNWKLEDTRETVRKDDKWEEDFTRILYRPFDNRWVFYHDALIERPRREVMHHMLQENLGLLTCRQQSSTSFYHTFVCNTIAESCVVSNKTTEINYLFPLYLYQPKDKPKKKSLSSVMMLFEPKADYLAKKPNISQELFEKLKETFKKAPSPEEIFYYIYAVLYSNIYREKYAEFLKIDFPRVPFTNDYKLFKKIGEYGERLIELHLLKPEELGQSIARFQGEGDNKVEKPKYEQPPQSPLTKGELRIVPLNKGGQGVVYINKDQYFEGISQEVWEYRIGGYQVLDKWLKDRKDRALSLDDIKHYCWIVAVLKKTIEIQDKIDSIYTEIEKSQG